ncbi:ribosome maturation factor RimP [Oerskovia sp. Sa1BUA8]|uniref:Ribosome maturation factor RimP n=1 Tax=Oerskovia douganii TaxID=2762210 RepID=A0A9D5YX64_9CELL|nr:ribosome maturation factor RimP [Oerskovia douganii]
MVRDADLYLEDVTVTLAGSRSVVRITLDLPEDAPGNLDLDRVAEVSRDINTALDTSNAFPGAYTLEISTPGTSRPLTELRHFKRARGRIVRLALQDGGTVEGRLRDVEDGNLLLTDAAVESVALEDVVRGAIQVELKRALEVDLGPEMAVDANPGADAPNDEEV